jgi:hypothetical protein
LSFCLDLREADRTCVAACGYIGVKNDGNVKIDV